MALVVAGPLGAHGVQYGGNNVQVTGRLGDGGGLHAGAHQHERHAKAGLVGVGVVLEWQVLAEALAVVAQDEHHRVIGVPGDRVTYRNKQLTVNGSPVPQDWLAELPSGRFMVKMGREVLPDSDGHLMQIDNRRGPRNFSVVVTPGHYFMMGDNRDNSSDSRVWGQVPEGDIVGQAVAIWMHWESLFSIPSFGRVGAID